MPPSRNDNQTPTPPGSPSPNQPSGPWRNDNETTTRCVVCQAPFTPIRRRRYCTPACRQAAWRARHTPPASEPDIVIPRDISRRVITVYYCSDCDTRTLGEQWCHDCHRPRTRLDAGGLCPHCDEPITISDITDQHRRPTAHR